MDRMVDATGFPGSTIDGLVYLIRGFWLELEKAADSRLFPLQTVLLIF